MSTVAKAITIHRPSAEVFQYWRDLENLPRFMHHVLSVDDLGVGRTRWRVKAPKGRTVEWEAQQTVEERDQRIAWRTIAGDVSHEGEVRFSMAPGERGTEVHVELTYHVPGGKTAEAVAKVFGEEPAIQIADDLRRLKQVLEIGEVLRSTGSPAGTGQSIPQQEPSQPAVETGTGKEVHS